MRSTHDDVPHAVFIAAYEAHRWKGNSCSPNLDGDFVQKFNRLSATLRCQYSFTKSVSGLLGVSVTAFALNQGNSRKTRADEINRGFDPDRYLAPRLLGCELISWNRFN